MLSTGREGSWDIYFLWIREATADKRKPDRKLGVKPKLKDSNYTNLDCVV